MRSERVKNITSEGTCIMISSEIGSAESKPNTLYSVSLRDTGSVFGRTFNERDGI